LRLQHHWYLVFAFAFCFVATAAALTALDEPAAATTRNAIAAASYEDLLKLWPFSVGPNVIANLSCYLTLHLWFLNHPIHPTAQFYGDAVRR
jgi:hypothetical protein